MPSTVPWSPRAFLPTLDWFMLKQFHTLELHSSAAWERHPGDPTMVSERVRAASPCHSKFRHLPCTLKQVSFVSGLPEPQQVWLRFQFLVVRGVRGKLSQLEANQLPGAGSSCWRLTDWGPWPLSTGREEATLITPRFSSCNLKYVLLLRLLIPTPTISCAVTETPHSKLPCYYTYIILINNMWPHEIGFLKNKRAVFLKKKNTK